MQFRSSIRLFVHKAMIISLLIILIFNCNACNNSQNKNGEQPGSPTENDKDLPDSGENNVNAIMLLPKNPKPGEQFRVLITGSGNLRKAQITIEGVQGKLKSVKSTTGDNSTLWRVDDFEDSPAGKYKVSVSVKNSDPVTREFEISALGEKQPEQRGWDSKTEIVYSAWINALFQGSSEQTSWSALHEVTGNSQKNFLYNYLALGEDDPGRKISLVMQPDCADNPFFLRAYFAWKLGLPFGYHICDRGYPGHNPGTGQWITYSIGSSKTDPVQSFNTFLRRLKDGVHSGTGRTALDNENSDYYPVKLEKEALRPGTVYADPYGHTLTLVGSIPQTGDHPGLLLAVDAQPDGTVGIKRFWKGNFLFNTSGVTGEPGFKAFRPVLVNKGMHRQIKNEELTSESGYLPYSLQQRKMDSEVFYRTMERIINPEPLDPESQLLDLIQALHEQLLVRVTSVANGEEYFRTHPREVISMPSNANGIFLAGGQWENFSTPNRDLRLLIAIDAVSGFPDLVARSPEDYKISGNLSAEEVKIKLEKILEKKSKELTIKYKHSDGSEQELTIAEILNRRAAFEMGYNPNDGVEIRWGAPENSDERKKCVRSAPASQVRTMLSVRTWFSKRLHPPT